MADCTGPGGPTRDGSSTRYVERMERLAQAIVATTQVVVAPWYGLPPEIRPALIRVATTVVTLRLGVPHLIRAIG